MQTLEICETLDRFGTRAFHPRFGHSGEVVEGCHAPRHYKFSVINWAFGVLLADPRFSRLWLVDEHGNATLLFDLAEMH